MSNKRKVNRILIMGAAGRDFHNFNIAYRNDPDYCVVAFTATQIPDIEGRVYPPELAGELYPDGIPIRPEEELESIVRAEGVDEVWFSYSDVPHEYVMDKATKLETIFDRIELLEQRYETLLRDREITYLKQCLEAQQQGQDTQHLLTEFQSDCVELKAELDFLRQINSGGEFMTDEQIASLKSLPVASGGIWMETCSHC